MKVSDVVILGVEKDERKREVFFFFLEIFGFDAVLYLYLSLRFILFFSCSFFGGRNLSCIVQILKL